MNFHFLPPFAEQLQQFAIPIHSQIPWGSDNMDIEF